VGSALILARIVIKPYYFEVKGTQLIINRDLFRKDTVEISNIKKIVLEQGPFSKSLILLKDQKRALDFNYFIVNNKDLNRLKEKLQLNVE
jgi:hypothetical protein